MNCLFVYNEKLREYDHIVIYGVSRKARYIFMASLYFEYVVTAFCDNDYVQKGIKIYNREILSEGQVNCLSKCAVLVDSDDLERLNESSLKNYDIFVNDLYGEKSDIDNHCSLFEVNPNIRRRPVVVWGCGFVGKEIIQELELADVCVDCCIDSKYGEGCFEGKPVYSVDKYVRREDINLVIAITKFESIYNDLPDEVKKHIFIDIMSCAINWDNLIIAGERLYKVLGGYSLYAVSRFVLGKQVFLSGDKDKISTTGRIIKKLINRDVVILDEFEDILYEEPDTGCLLVCAGEQSAYEKRAAEIGLHLGKEYMFPFLESRLVLSYTKQDLFLGNTYCIAENMPGMTTFWEKDAGMCIVTLGGSTTEAQLYSFKCWSELLCSELKQNGYSVKVICCGIADYNSWHEFMKLSRDVLDLNPDIVISYSGFNDCNRDMYKEYSIYPQVNMSLMQRAESRGYIVGRKRGIGR